MRASLNFGFLEPHGAQLYRLAALAEHYFSTDPNTCLFKLRQFAELLAQEIAARAGLFTSTEEPFIELLAEYPARGMYREDRPTFFIILGGLAMQPPTRTRT